MLEERSNSQTNSAGESSSIRSASIPDDRKWPERIIEFSRELQLPRDERSLDEARGKVWQLLNAAINIYLRSHAARMGPLAREDREDLAAEKSLDLLRRIESGKTDFSNRSPGEIVSFVSTVARNELLDLFRSRGRQIEPSEANSPEGDDGGTYGMPRLPLLPRTLGWKAKSTPRPCSVVRSF